MFKILDSDWNVFREKIMEDIGFDLMEDLQREIQQIKKHYDGAANDIKFWKEDDVVGSTKWAPATINQGMMPGTYPNIDRIRDWVRNTKDGGKNVNLSDTEINQIAWKVTNKIKEKGIDPTWYVDAVLSKWESGVEEPPLSFSEIVFAGDSPIPFADYITSQIMGENPRGYVNDRNYL